MANVRYKDHTLLTGGIAAGDIFPMDELVSGTTYQTRRATAAMLQAWAQAGLVIGTDVQAFNADLSAIAALASANDDIIQRKAGVWVNRTIAQYKTDLNYAAVASSGSASDLSAGTLPDARFPATLPAASGANLTALNATNLASGTVNAARLPDLSATYQPTNANLTTIAGLTPTNDDVMQYKAGAWANRTIAQLKTDLSLSGTNTGDQTSVSGNAGTATALQNARTINGVSFDGTANITITVPVATGITGLGTGVATALAINVGSAGAVVVNGGALGTPSGGTLTNATGLPPTTGIVGWPANASGVLTNNGSGTLTWAAAGGGLAVGAAITSGTATRVLYEGAGNVLAEAAGFTFDGTSVLTLGVAGASVGAVAFKNATSGTITVQPVTGALGTVTLSLPATTTTLAGLGIAQTFTAQQTIAPGTAVSPLILTGGTVTTSQPLISATQTWNDSGVTFTGLLLNATSTASASASKLLELQLGGTRVYGFSKGGTLTIQGASANDLLTIGVRDIAYSSNGLGQHYILSGDTTGSGGPAQLRAGSGFTLTWQSTTRSDAGSADLALARSAASALRITNGSTGAGSLVLGTSTVGSIGTSGVGVFAQAIGTAPGSSPADTSQLYTADWNGAGTAAAHFRNEEGHIIKMCSQAVAAFTNNMTSGGTNDQTDTWSDLTLYATDAAAIRNAVYQLSRKLAEVVTAQRANGLFR